jgi:cytochrome c biogenesis protein
MLKNKSLTWLARKLANLQLAISLLFSIGFLVAIGTIIEQNQSLLFYQTNYPELNPLFGFLTWKVIILLKLNELYTSPAFIGLVIIFGASLLSCTFTTQLPSVKKFRLWKFLALPLQISKFESKSAQKLDSLNTVTCNLYEANYHFFRQGKKNYAYSGLIGRVAPIIVHVSILLLLIGSTLGGFKGYEVQEIISRGEIFHTQNLIKFGNLSNIPQTLSWRVNDFWITYTKENKTNQFYSDLSLLDNFGTEIKRKTIFVNEPFLYKQVTLYQTDWDILGIKVKLSDNSLIQIPLSKISKNGKNLWLGQISLTNAEKTSIVLNDLTGRIFLYDKSGTLITDCYVGDYISLNNQKFLFSDFITLTGLQIKTDPGLKIVYSAFFFLMVSAYSSFISYSQIWGVENNNQFIFGGKANRAVLYFQREFRNLIQKTR